MKYAFIFAFVMSLVLFGFWIAGFNFNERGGTALFAYLLSTASATLACLAYHDIKRGIL